MARLSRNMRMRGQVGQGRRRPAGRRDETNGRDRDYKASYLNRVKGRWQTGRCRPGRVYEAEKDFLAAESAVRRRRWAMQRARADQLERRQAGKPLEPI